MKIFKAGRPELLGFFVGGETLEILGSSTESATTKSASSVSVTVTPTLVTSSNVEISCNSS